MFRFLSFGLTMVVMAGLLVGSLAGAADSASLVTTVTPGIISVTVNAAAFDYGAVPLGDYCFYWCNFLPGVTLSF